MSHFPVGSDTTHELHALLGDWLRTRHLAQPLQSMDRSDSRASVADRFRGLSVVGVEDHGQLIGSIAVEALHDDRWLLHIQPVSGEQVIEGDASMLELISRLSKRHWLFVRQTGALNGFVSRSDLQRAPFRMLLFGLISLFEMRLLYLVGQFYEEADIAAVLSPNRIDKARELHAARKIRGEELHLVDCLQIADKRDLLLEKRDCLRSLGFESNNQASRFFARVEALRDRLVHANDLIAGSNWEEVLGVTAELASFLDRASTDGSGGAKAAHAPKE